MQIKPAPMSAPRQHRRRRQRAQARNHAQKKSQKPYFRSIHANPLSLTNMPKRVTLIPLGAISRQNKRARLTRANQTLAHKNLDGQVAEGGYNQNRIFGKQVVWLQRTSQAPAELTAPFRLRRPSKRGPPSIGERCYHTSRCRIDRHADPDKGSHVDRTTTSSTIISSATNSQVALKEPHL